MHDLDPTLTPADIQVIEEFCRYELVTLTQLDAHRVKATFPDSAGDEESVIGGSVVSVLLDVARRQKVSEYLRGTHAMEQQLMVALHNVSVPFTITKIREQAYTWQVVTRTGTAFTLVDAVARGLQALMEQGRDKPTEEQQP
jgi:hypothetical protein